jgi:hypothetical protein
LQVPVSPNRKRHPIAVAVLLLSLALNSVVDLDSFLKGIEL